MSDLLQLATDLRQRSDESLSALMLRRPISGSPKDFFDLAQSLLTTKSIASSLVKLSASEAKALSQIVLEPGPFTNLDTAMLALVELGLAFIAKAQGDAVKPFAVTAEVAAPLLRGKSFIDLAQPSESSEIPEPDGAHELGLAAIAAFETQQAITELILDVEQNLVKHIGKSGFGVGDVKRLAAHLRKTPNQARSYYRLAHQLGLLELIGDRWWLAPAAQTYLTSKIPERWKLLAQLWIGSLGEVGSSQLLQMLASHSNRPQLQPFSNSLKAVFPLADSALGGVIDELLEQAHGIGFSVAGAGTQLLRLCLQNQFAAAAATLAPHLPQVQHSLIVQADLSLIAPGPLDTQTELKLRQIATVEQVAVASTYRLSALSLSNALECGLEISDIRELLTSLSNKPLPQPVEYLLNEAAKRFARLTISAGPTGAEASVLKSTDGILLTEILNDSRLRPFAFYALTASSLASRFEPQVTYYGLRDFGYVPVRIAADGSVLSPENKSSWNNSVASSNLDPRLRLIADLRMADDRVGAQPDDQDLTRQIQLAMKNKASLLVTLTDRSGAEVEFKIVPSALVNGRLRGLDKKADIERTLPLDRIIRVAIG